MIHILTDFGTNTWQLIAEMAPYLLFGFAVAGLLHILIQPKRVRQLLGQSGIGSVFKACLVGVPMPLCSCSVIPVAASLRKNGASQGATTSFLSSTPQTGVDSIMATYALMGGAFTIVRVIVAFISGIVAGLLVDLFTKEQATTTKFTHVRPSNVGSMTLYTAPTSAQASSVLTPITNAPAGAGAEKTCCGTTEVKPKRSFGDAIRYGFITLPADLSTALFVGLALGGFITTVLPEGLLSGAFSSGLLAFLLATLISLPLYICATASIPLAYALISAGLSPGAALILLIVGPATNTTTVAAVWNLLGRKVTLIYIGSLIVVSWVSGVLFNFSISAEQMSNTIHLHSSMKLASWQHACGATLVTILLISILNKYARKKTQPSGCCSN